MREHRIVGLIFLSLCYMMMSVACSYEPKPPVVAPPPTLPPTTEPEPVTIIWAFWGIHGRSKLTNGLSLFLRQIILILIAGFKGQAIFAESGLAIPARQSLHGSATSP